MLKELNGNRSSNFWLPTWFLFAYNLIDFILLKLVAEKESENSLINKSPNDNENDKLEIIINSERFESE